MRKIFLLAVCTLLILPSQWDSSRALANDSCLSLNAQQYLEASSRLIPLDSNFTIEFDFYLSKDNKSYGEVISQGGQPNPFYIGINPDLGIRAGDTWVDTGAKMPLQKWVHIALTRTSGSVGTFYIDGKVVATINNYVLNNIGTATRVGAQYDTGASERITGCIDNLMIWKSVRTANEVVQDSLVKSPITNANLIAFYGFDSVSSTGLIEDNAVPSNSLRPLNTPELFPVTDPSTKIIPIRIESGALSEASVASGNPSYYVNSWIDRVPDNFRSGFGWYSTAWPLTDTVIEGMQLGLSGSWVTPNNESEPASIAQQVCANAAEWVRNDTINSSNGSRGFDLLQTIEGSLGWWANQKFKTLMPKFTIGPVQDCYSNQLQGPGWNFFGFGLGEDPTPRNRTGLVQISNRMLIPPDGLTLEPDFSGAQVGYSWMSLPLPTFNHAYNNMAGENSWTMFINSKNFKGPLVFIAPQFFADGLVKNPVQKGLTLDVKGGRLGSLAAEWASIPFYKYTDTAGTIYTKIPGLEFPVDANGNFALSRNLTAYGSSAISDAFRSALASGGALPQSTNAAGIFSPLLNAQSPNIYQEGKILGTLSSLLAVKVFESRAAYGFSMGGDARLEKIPQYYKEVGGSRIVIKESEAPTALVNAKFGSLMQTSTHVYQEPSWWKQSPAASGDLTADLRDGSQVTYRWYKFVDQPSLQRFEMNAAEKAGIQGAIEKMQKEWNNFAMMKEPKVGSLVSFDEGLMVTPPKGLEIGYVPIVVKQKAADKSAVDKALAAIFSAGNNIESIMKAAADKAAADKAAAVKAAADKAAADKAAADKAAADKAAADKAAADKAAADKAAADKAAAVKAAAVKAAAVKKLTITCVKGKIIKKVNAVKPVCPTGYTKK